MNYLYIQAKTFMLPTFMVNIDTCIFLAHFFFFFFLLLPKLTMCYFVAGVILSVILESSADKPHFLLVLDAKSFEEIARAEMPRPQSQIPPTVHGIFLPMK